MHISIKCTHKKIGLVIYPSPVPHETPAFRSRSGASWRNPEFFQVPVLVMCVQISTKLKWGFVSNNNGGSSPASFTDWISQLQEFIFVAGSLHCSEYTRVTLYGQNCGNFWSIFADETESSACWASFTSDFLLKCSIFIDQYLMSYFSLIQYLPNP